MKPRITLEQAVGQRLVGQIGNQASLLLVFSGGYVFTHAEVDFENQPRLHDWDVPFGVFGSEELAGTELGSVAEFDEISEKRKAERLANRGARMIERAQRAIGELCDIDPEAARKLCAEVLR